LNAPEVPCPDGAHAAASVTGGRPRDGRLQLAEEGGIDWKRLVAVDLELPGGDDFDPGDFLRPLLQKVVHSPDGGEGGGQLVPAAANAVLEAALDLPGGQGLAVVKPHVLAQREDKASPSFSCLPPVAEVRNEVPLIVRGEEGR